MNQAQPAILSDVPETARALTFGMRGGCDPRPGLAALCALPGLEGGTVGLGEPLVLALHAQVPGLRSFPAVTGPGSAFPSTQGALWVLLRGGDRGLLLQRSQHAAEALGPGFYLLEALVGRSSPRGSLASPAR